MDSSDEYRLINLTNRDVRFIRSDASDIILPRSGMTLGVNREIRSIHEVAGITVATGRYTVPSVPESIENAGYVVTWRTLMTLKALGFDVDDMHCPDAFVKDQSGRIIGATALLRLPENL